MSDIEKRLAEIRARLAAATPGPWVIYERGINGNIDSVGPIYGYDYDSLEIDEGDAVFVSHVRDDVPWLVDQLRQARDLLAKFAALNPLDWLQVVDNHSFSVETLWFCWCCDQDSDSRETFVHSPDCLWVAARAMLGVEDNAKDAGWHTDYLETRDPKGVGDVQR